MFSRLGMGHSKLAKGSQVFGRFFGMKGKKLVPHHPLEIMAMGKQGAMFYGLTQSSEFEGVGCKDVMV
jgi:hypothetical protein